MQKGGNKQSNLKYQAKILKIKLILGLIEMLSFSIFLGNEAPDNVEGFCFLRLEYVGVKNYKRKYLIVNFDKRICGNPNFQI